MKRKALFFLCWISLAGVLQGQTLEQTLAFARAQTAEGQTALALKTWQRVLYFGGSRYSEECRQNLAELNAETGNFDKSLFYCELLYQGAKTDSVRYEALFRKAGILMLQSDYSKALLELLSLPGSLPEPWLSRKQLYLGSAHFGLKDYKAARVDLLPLFAADDTQGRETFEKLMREAERVARKNPKTARWLSTFLPGAGQFYAGDVKNGLNSLLLNALLGYWFIATAVNYSFIDAGATVTPWLFRYYSGGIRHAGEILNQEKEERLRKTYRKMLALIKEK